jgi:hypothetical protein
MVEELGPFAELPMRDTMTKKTEVTKVSNPETVSSVAGVVRTINLSNKRQPSEYLGDAIDNITNDGSVVIAGLGLASSNTMKLALTLVKMGYVYSDVHVGEKMMPGQRYEKDSVDPLKGKWIDDPSKPSRPVPQLSIRISKKIV